MSITAFIVKVPAAEPVVGNLRSRFDASARLGVPAHITLLFPFMAPELITPAVLARAQAALNEVPSFHFSLASVGQFPATVYLSPTPAEPFIMLTQVLVRQFPDFPPYGGTHQGVIPHLTVAHGSAIDVRAVTADLESRLRAARPILAECTSVTLLENASGRWREMHAFHLPALPA